MKNCVIAAVGNSSLHRKWEKGKCSFDLHLIVYDESYARYIHNSPYVCSLKGYKLRVVYQYLMLNPKVLDAYEYFFLPDDDILMDSCDINTLFGMMRLYKLQIAQPALVNSYYLWDHTLKDSYCELRYTNFVEMMIPCFSRTALKKVLFTFNENKTGWGTETHWPLLIHAGHRDMAIIDAVSVIHTRPIQSGQAIHRREAMEYLRKYRLVTKVVEYGNVPVKSNKKFLLDRDSHKQLACLLKRLLPKFFQSDSFGVEGYGGYINLLYDLGQITQSKQYIDMAMTMLEFSPQCYRSVCIIGNSNKLGAYIECTKKNLEDYLTKSSSQLNSSSPIAQAYLAYKCFCSNQDKTLLSQIRTSLGQVRLLQYFSFRELLMLADILLNNQIQVHETSET